MTLVLFLLAIIILILLIVFILLLSSIKIEIKECKILYENKKKDIIFVMDLAIYFLNKIKLFKITIDNDKIKESLSSGKINIKKIRDKRKANKYIIKDFKKVKYEIEYFKIDGYFSTFNEVISVWIYTFLQSFIPIIIASNNNGRYINKIKFLNIKENRINISFNCIISIKIVNIINILRVIKKKGGKINNGKSSNRGTYAYSYE